MNMETRLGEVKISNLFKYFSTFLIFVGLDTHCQIITDSLFTKVYHNDRVYFFDINNTYLTSGSIKLMDDSLAQDSIEQRFTIKSFNNNTLAICNRKLDIYSVEDSTLTLLSKNTARTFIGTPVLFKRNDSLYAFVKSQNNNFKNSLFYLDFTDYTWQSVQGERIDGHVSDLQDLQTLDYKDELFVYGGIKPHAEIPFKLNSNRLLAVYNFSKHKWRHLKFHNMNDLGEKYTTRGKTALFIDKDLGNISLLDFEDNELYIRPLKSVFGALQPLKMTLKDPQTLLVFGIDQIPELVTYDVNKAFYFEKSHLPIYVDETYIMPWVLVIMTLILGIFAIKLIRKRVKAVQKLSYNGERIWFGQKFITLSVEHQKMIQFMLRGETLETADIVGLFTGKNYSVSHMHKLKNDLISDLKQIFLNLTDRQDVLIVEKSKGDSRMSVYRLDLNQFDETSISALNIRRKEKSDQNNRGEE